MTDRVTPLREPDLDRAPQLRRLQDIAIDHDTLRARLMGRLPVRGIDGCCPWTGTFFTSGYGRVIILRKSWRVHRVIFELMVRPLEANEWVLHKCDNPPCCNHNHLFGGTPKLNSQDRDRKGRGADRRGEGSGTAKLCLGEVEDIRRKLAIGGYGAGSALAREYRVSEATISLIRHGRIWNFQ